MCVQPVFTLVNVLNKKLRRLEIRNEVVVRGDGNCFHQNVAL